MKIRKFFSSLYKCSLKVFSLILALFFALGVPALTRTAAAPAVSMRTVKPTEPIEHLFTHCLIAHPEIAFAKNNEYGRHLDRDCLTPSEFRRIMLGASGGVVCAFVLAMAIYMIVRSTKQLKKWKNNNLET